MTVDIYRPRLYGAAGGVAGRITIDGRFFVNQAGTFRACFQSGLSLLVKAADARAAFLDETRALGFNGFRTFAGDLGWAGQTPASARAVLPTLLDEAAVRGLYVYVSALQGGGYDVEAHLREVAAIVAAHPNALLEVANEIGHPSQSDLGKDPTRLLLIAGRVIPVDVTWTLGAPVDTDEPTPQGTYPTDGGEFNDAHLDRGRDFYNQVRRVREIAAISEATGKPAMSGEPIGAGEAWIAGKRESDPTFFYILGLLCRGFEVAGVFHSEDGLNGRLLGPNQRRCAEEYVAGGHAIPTADRLRFYNATWERSPVKGYDMARVVRCYSFLAGDKGWTVLIGLQPDPEKPGTMLDPKVEWSAGWRPARIVDERPGVQLVELTR